MPGIMPERHPIDPEVGLGDRSRPHPADSRPHPGHRHPLHDRDHPDRRRRRALAARLHEPRRRRSSPLLLAAPADPEAVRRYDRRMPPSTAPGRLRGHELLAAVAAGTAGGGGGEVLPSPAPPLGRGAVGEQFLRSLVRHVAEAFAAKLVHVAEASDPSGMHVRVLAAWYDGAFIEEPFEYDTAGQPCAVVTDYPWVSFPDALTERFPDDLEMV